MIKVLDKEKLEEYKRFSVLLDSINEFVKKHQILTYIEFDYYVVHDMTLFSVEPDFDFEKLEKTIHNIKKSIPAVKRIFTKPIIVLKDTDDVLPVENARIINQNTLLHIANHGQYVANITNKGIKPRKLLTRIYEDDYSIYENIIFCNYIDEVLSIIKRNRKTLNTLLYASDIMKFNLLEKLNHLNYFLALGKLHTGYIRDFSQYFNLSKELLNELSSISKAINPRLYRPVYKKNSVRNKNLYLKKTNIFISQKDYRLVYKTYKNLINDQIKTDDLLETFDFEELNKNYLIYVQILTLFSIGHFNFEMNPNMKINLDSLDVTFNYKEWEINVFNNNMKEIFLYFKKDTTYKIVITSNELDTKTINSYKKLYGVNEILLANHFEEEYLNRNDLYITMEDIDSFRRIQQVILKGMIYSDTKRDVCPFCGGKVHKDMYKGFHQCNDCMTQIKEGLCEETKKTYFFTDNAHLKKYVIKKSDFKKDEYWYYDKQVEGLMYFRNITKINENSDIICPHCKKVHEK